ncbi:MAG TPA: helix-turn-helix transcriptional regulator [Burkholderiales bacterium]|nr:helix-turn-helix transcriptional regulator [Burkholderiales bacterium]
MKVSLEDFSAVIAGILALPAQDRRAVLASLDRLAIPAYLLDPAGSIQRLNASAQALLAQFEPLSLTRAFRDALRSAIREGARTSRLLLAVPSGVCDVVIAPLGTDGALVVLAPREREDAGEALDGIRRFYGLTVAEARVMRALSVGCKVDEIARTHGVQASTVRAQLRSLFEKTGVNRQTDLVRLALTGAPPVLAQATSSVAAPRLRV